MSNLTKVLIQTNYNPHKALLLLNPPPKKHTETFVRLCYVLAIINPKGELFRSDN